MDVTSKLLREVEFRDRLRGYDTDEVDEFLERVAVGLDELYAQLAAAKAEADRSGASAGSPALGAAPAEALPPVDDDSIRRTLVLAQRTADMAIAEAKEEAQRILDDARSEAERVVGEANEAARSLRSAAEVDLTQRVTRLSEQRDLLEQDVHSLTSLVESERARLADSLGVLLSNVSNLQVSEAFGAAAARQSSTPPPPFLGDETAVEEAPDDLELDLNLDLLEPTDPKGPPRAERGFHFSEATTGEAPPVDGDDDDALWERWANSGESTDNGAADPFDTNG